MRGLSQLVDCIEWSIRNEPSKWSRDEYMATNSEMQCEVWIANGCWGLHVKIPGECIGNVTMASTFFGWATPWRRRLYRAARSLPIKTDSDSIRRFLDQQYARVASRETVGEGGHA